MSRPPEAVTDLLIRSRQDTVETLNWYAMRSKNRDLSQDTEVRLQSRRREAEQRWAATKKVTKLAGMSAKKTAPAVIPASKAAKDVVKKASKKAAKTQPVKKSVAPAKKITQVKKAAAPQAESAVASV